MLLALLFQLSDKAQFQIWKLCG